jgi:hypothetical protein
VTTTLALPNLDPKALEAGKAALERDTADARALTITDPDTYAAVGAVLIERLREYDVAKKFRDDITKPVHAHWKRLCDLLSCKPHEDLIAAIKKAIGDYDLRELAAKQVATEQARAVFAAPVPDIQAMTAALTVANAPEATAEGVGTRFVWKVKRYNVDLMAPEDLLPNEPKINAIARAHRGEDPPFVRGVVFELAAEITGKR